MKKRVTIITIGIVVVLITFQLFINKQKINAQKELEKTEVSIKVPVLVDTVTYRNVSERINKTGTLIPFKKTVVYAQVAGNLTRVDFELGSKVRKGDILAVVDADKLKIDLQNAQAKAEKLKHDLTTYQELLAGDATTQESVDQHQLDYTDAKNQVAQFQKQLSETRLRAPITGLISEKNVEEGVFVSNGAELATVIDIRELKVQVYLTEREIYTVNEQDSVAISTDVYPDKTFIGKISYVSSQADDTHNYLVEISLNNQTESPLKSGTFVYASFQEVKQKELLTIPRIALLDNTDKPQVYIVSNNKATLRKLQLGSDYGDQVVVLEGLKAGDLVVTSGQINLYDGSEISITNKVSK
ncbi:hypothetical protein ACIVBQ_000943 [Tenacibaculum discolor]